MSWIEDIKNRQNDNSKLSRQWLETAEQDAPYSVLPAMMYLKSNGIKDNEDVLARLAIAFPDRQALALILGEDADALTGFYPAEHAEQVSLNTITTIDRFLDNYGKTSPGEIEAITRAIFNPQPDYADVLAAQEQEQGGSRAATDDAQDELIDKFIAQSQVDDLRCHNLGEDVFRFRERGPVNYRIGPVDRICELPARVFDLGAPFFFLCLSGVFSCL